METLLHHGGYRHGSVAGDRRLKQPARYGFHGALVQAQSRPANYTNLRRAAIDSDFNREQHHTLETRLAGFLRIFGLHLMNHLGSSRDAWGGSSAKTAASSRTVAVTRART